MTMTREKQFVFGVDAGGTSVRVALADEDGLVIAEARGTAQADGGPAALDGPSRQVVADVGQVRAVCAGITKFSRAGVRAAWEADLAARFPRAASVEVVPDFVTAFVGATGGVGIAVIAGTGSVVYGENEWGGAARVGGRGWEYGDEGSGAHLTTEAVRRTLRALDGLGPASDLTRVVCYHLGSDEAGDLAERARRRAEREGRGFLVPLVLERARAGDKEATALFVGAGGWLASQVRASAVQLGFDMPDTPQFPIATVGGLWEAGDLLLQPFGLVLARWLPHAEVVPPRASPVYGAVHRAAVAVVKRR